MKGISLQNWHKLRKVGAKLGADRSCDLRDALDLNQKILLASCVPLESIDEGEHQLLELFGTQDDSKLSETVSCSLLYTLALDMK